MAALVRRGRGDGTRIVLFRRPIEHRAGNRAELEGLVFTVVGFAVANGMCLIAVKRKASRRGEIAVVTVWEALNLVVWSAGVECARRACPRRTR